MKRIRWPFICCLLCQCLLMVVFIDGSYAGAVTVKNIHPEIINAKTERVCIQLSDYALPSVRALEGSQPRVFVDIQPVSRWDGPELIPVNGKLILRVRTHLHREIRTLRIVLDLEPSGDYAVSQTYITSGNIFCLEVVLNVP